MKKRITAPAKIDGTQALVDHRQAMLDVILDQIPNRSTFASLGELIGRSKEWVRLRLDHALLVKIGPHYFIPKGVAREFVCRVYGRPKAA